MIAQCKKNTNKKTRSHIRTSSGTYVEADIVEEIPPIIQKSQQKEVKHKGFRQSDIFLKPFENGICIEENLTTNHRLLFNKFPARRHHVLVVTKEPESQANRLNTKDFMAALVALKTLDEAFMCYN